MFLTNRKPGDVIEIGDQIKVTLEGVKSGRIYLCIQHSGKEPEFVKLSVWDADSFHITDDISVSAVKGTRAYPLLGVSAPKSIQINEEN